MDQLKEFLGILKRQHFWFIAPVLLALGVAGWWISTKTLNADFEKNRTSISGWSTQMQGVSQKTPHPNTVYHNEMNKLIAERRDNVRSAWQTKWERQKEQLKWPDQLPADFRRQVEQMRPIEKVDPENNRSQQIEPSLRRTYGSFINTELPRLAASMGSKWQPATARGTTSPVRGFGGSRESTGEAIGATADDEVVDESVIVNWDPKNQAVLGERFDWGTRAPSTQEVLYAQEDLWVLETIVEIIRKTNADARTRTQAGVKEIISLQFGKDVQPSTFRVMVPAAVGAEDSTFDDTADQVVEMSEEGSGADLVMNENGEPVAQTNPLSELVKNRYVDENYQPIPDLETLMSSVTVAKRIPIRLRVKMDQRHINKLLVECANSPLTLEVRQLRFNPQGEATTSRFGGPSVEAEGAFSGLRAGQTVKTLVDYQSFDRVVELFGIIYIFNPVDDAVLGGATDENLTASRVLLELR